MLGSSTAPIGHLALYLSRYSGKACLSLSQLLLDLIPQACHFHLVVSPLRMFLTHVGIKNQFQSEIELFTQDSFLLLPPPRNRSSQPNPTHYIQQPQPQTWLNKISIMLRLSRRPQKITNQFTRFVSRPLRIPTRLYCGTSFPSSYFGETIALTQCVGRAYLWATKHRVRP